jgi:dTDP-glucose 4,6-dehydratase
MKIILVTGSLGFIATNLIKMLLDDKNNKVIGLDKVGYASTPLKFKNYYKGNNFTFLKINMCNFQLLYKKIKYYKPNIIINLAAETSVDKSIDSPTSFIKNNVISTLNLLESLRKLNLKKTKKIIHISTDEVYGDFYIQPRTESDPCNSNSPYSASKASADNICKAYRKTYGLPITIINSCNNYGPYQFTEKFIPTAIINLISKKKIPIYGNGRNIREWIYVEDFCLAIKKVINFKTKHDHYNVGSNFRLSNLNLAKLIIDFFHKKKIKNYNKHIVFVKDRPGHDLKYLVNSNKFRKETKWKESFSFFQAINKTIDWYKTNEEWLQNTYKTYKNKRQGMIKLN